MKLCCTLVSLPCKLKLEISARCFLNAAIVFTGLSCHKDEVFWNHHKMFLYTAIWMCLKHVWFELQCYFYTLPYNEECQGCINNYLMKYSWLKNNFRACKKHRAPMPDGEIYVI